MTAQRTFTFGVRIGSALVIALLSLSIASSQTLYWLGTLGEGTLAEGTGVSADGRIVVGFSATQETVNYRAFSWSVSTGITQLETPPTDRGSYAQGVSADGEVIVGYRVNAQGRFVPAR